MEKIPALQKRIWAYWKQRWLGVLVAAFVPAVIGFLLLTTALGETFVLWSYDIPFLLRGEIETEEAIMVYMDEPSHKILNQPYGVPWERRLHAHLIDRLTEDGAKAVVFDILFSDKGQDAEVDKQMAEAIRRNGKVILAADLTYNTVNNTRLAQLDVPWDDFYHAANGQVGLDSFFPDGDLRIRHYLPVSKREGLASEALAAATIAGSHFPTNEAFLYNQFWINHYGKSGTIPSVSYYKAMTNDIEMLPKGFVHNKVVFVGAKFQTKFEWERKDEYTTPFSMIAHDNFTSGVEVHATCFLNILRGEWLNRFPYQIERILILLSGFGFGIGLLLCRPMRALLVALLAIITVMGINYVLFVHKFYWFAWLIIALVQIPLALIWSVTINSVQLYVQNRLLEQSLGKHLSPKRVKQLLRNKTEFLQPGAEKETLTILFSDIENFTTISEGMDSDDLAKLMNRYFQTAVENCIHKTDGTVVKYIGDAIFSFWNAPENQMNHQELACEAALLLRKQTVNYSKDAKTYSLRTRIGLHTGEANVGNFGSEDRIDYTAIGESINLASRMEGLNKYLGTDILITAETKSGLGDRFVTRRLGQFQLKGFERIVEVHELVDLKERAEETKAWRDVFAMALEQFEQKHFDRAKIEFGRVLQMRNDGPARFYLHQVELFTTVPPSDKWRGEVELLEK